MDKSENAKWKTRLVEGEFPGREFDIEFWQEQGDEAIFQAAWEMVVLAGPLVANPTCACTSRTQGAYPLP